MNPGAGPSAWLPAPAALSAVRTLRDCGLHSRARAGAFSPALGSSIVSTSDCVQTILLELARVRVHGFSANEVTAACRHLMAEFETTYIERDQVYAEVPPCTCSAGGRSSSLPGLAEDVLCRIKRCYGRA